MTERLTRPHKPTSKAAGDKLRRNEIYPIVDEIQRADPTISLEQLVAKVKEDEDPRVVRQLLCSKEQSML